jgi:hypothetical protein
MMQTRGERTAVRVLHAADGLLMAEVNQVCVALWQKQPTHERFQIQKGWLDTFVRKNRGKAAFLCIVEAQVDPPDDDIRKASSAMITGHGSDLACVGLVIEGGGFRAAITRSVLSGIALFVRTPAPIKYFEYVGSAAEWISQYVPVGPVPVFVREVEEMRRRLEHERLSS